MRITIKRLGLAAYVKMHGGTLVEAVQGRFVFDSDKTAEAWGVAYANSCCNRHDTELVNLRKMIKQE